MKSWLIGTKNLNALIAAAPELAVRYFNMPWSFALGAPPPGWATTWVGYYKSCAAFAVSQLSTTWVLCDLEAWDDTPQIEQEHPAAYMDAFCKFAHARGQRVILTPARNLVTVSSGDCAKMPGETVDEAYLRSRLPEAGACGEVFECQAQADQGDRVAYAQLIQRAKSQLPAGHPLWAGLTTMRGDPVPAMTACYNEVLPLVDGFWLNTTPATIDVAVKFLTAITEKGST